MGANDGKKATRYPGVRQCFESGFCIQLGCVSLLYLITRLPFLFFFFIFFVLNVESDFERLW